MPSCVAYLLQHLLHQRFQLRTANVCTIFCIIIARVGFVSVVDIR